MEHSELISALMCPAFWVENEIITLVNSSALERNVKQGDCIQDYICIGADEYREFSDGRLCLQLKIDDILWGAEVTAFEGGHLFCLESEYQEPELKAFALAAMQLREPLANAMIGAENMQTKLQENSELATQLAQINRNLYRLMRTVCNMSDADLYKSQRCKRQETGNVTAVMEEILEKAAALAVKADRTLSYKLPKEPILMLLDVQKLERGVLNILSNAMRYSPKNSTVTAELKHIGKRLYFSVENTLSSDFVREPFARYLRQPGIDSGSSGIGLGISLIHSVATDHGGTLLIEQLPERSVRFTMTLAIRNHNSVSLQSPVLLPTDYAGGIDRALLELSDVLPDLAYIETN